ncbi:ectoine/hydroxyectoine ABC transporter permease subunit EhuC [Polycladomyces subterraneus]|uniref:Ectoine/hydroxyectoine ABC transporter permease subunit EhuC n=1 Tax=Polycladomyces subterraneus TaxID=1016997 RepID=A0ABT8IND2_9BACL|nr:ectoine/hydroxyectoine ABC transporter permease subunit EhuC [Polycladomyces subterraneus]MDN4594307.1 ectoine/hydroxyectoine ABC transporter permease subunit EhuC [Polycladomyces subterraneus]
MISIGVYEKILPALLQGLGITVQLTIFSAILAFFVSFLVGFGRLSRFYPLRVVCVFFVEVFRGTSLLVQLFWLYFVLPQLGIWLPADLAGLLALGLNAGAYGSEIVRSSILAIPKGQIEAAVALNMTPGQRMRSVILPQAFRIMLPSFGNLLIELLKGTSLVSLITISDMTFQATTLRTNMNQYTPEIFGLLLILYFLVAYPLTLGVRWLERRLSTGRS